MMPASVRELRRERWSAQARAAASSAPVRVPVLARFAALVHRHWSAGRLPGLLP